MNRGRFITIEGVEGVGKSTNLNLIERWITERDIEVVVTREPGGTGLGERVRHILLDKEESNMSAMTELLLMFASRSQHVEEVIKPALERGVWVVSDRFTDSSFAYQGGGRQLGRETVQRLESLVLDHFSPDLTIILDVDVETGLERATANTEADRFESEQREFFERVRATFLELGKGERYRVINTAQPLEKVETDIRGLLDEFYREC